MIQLTGNHRCRCNACGQHFNRVSTFERHRVGGFGTARSPGPRRCLTPDEMTSKGWSLNYAGFWIGIKRPPESLHVGQIAAIDQSDVVTELVQ